MNAPRSPARYDAVVIGAGFGGLGAALALAEAGARVLLCEALAYPGGCASTFERRGHRFEAGATLFSGFDEGQLVRRLLDRHGLAVRVDRLDPVVRLRTPELDLPVDADRDAFVARLCALPGAPAPALRRFFAWQRGVADLLWSLLADEELLPPLGPAALGRHLQRAPRTAALLPVLGRSLGSVLRSHGLDRYAPLRTWLDATCQITVQCGVDDVEAAFGLGAMDYIWRGTGHVHGGIGVLAEALCGAVERAGGQVLLARRAQRLAQHPGGWTVHLRDRVVEAPVVLANLLPQALPALGVAASPRAARLGEALAADGWGACVLYLGLDGAEVEQAHHLELVQDPAAPYVEGNHLFCSVSADDEDRGPPGRRTATVSTHVSVAALRGLPEAERAARVQAIQDRMRAGLARLAPELWARVVLDMPASPRTFERFTRRSEGLVGGAPRRVGLGWVRDLAPVQAAPGLWLVGDTVFPGQSTLAATLGGRCAAVAALATAGVAGVVPA